MMNLDNLSTDSQIFEILPGVCFQALYQDSTRFVKINGRVLEFLGYDPQYLISQQIILDTLIHPSDVFRRKNAINSSLSDLLPYETEYRVRHNDGGYLNVCERGQPTLNSSNIYQITGIINKIIETDTSKESLTVQVDLYRRVFDAVPELVAVLDEEQRILDINKAMSARIGLSPEEFRGKKCNLCIHNLPSLPECYSHQRSIPDNSVRFENIEKSSHKEVFKIISAPFTDESGRVLGSVYLAHDISDILEQQQKLQDYTWQLEESNLQLTETRKELAEFTTLLEMKVLKQTQEVRELSAEVLERNRMVEQLLKQKDQFINKLAHDLRTPLTPVIALLPLLKERVSDAYLCEIIRLFEVRIGYLREMMEEVVRYAHLNTLIYINDYQNVKLHAFIEEICTRHHKLIEEKLIQVINQISPDIVISLSRSQAPILFSNLMENAIQYNSMGGRITITGSTEENWVTIRIIDNGAGIPDDLIEHIWEEFTTGDPSRSDPHHKGLGLSIVKKIVTLHRGYIIATSQGKDQGTIFTLTLPVIPNLDNKSMSSSIL